ncbi:MAG TPA: thioredoxin domain-containing protein [Myxococcaceae bacterium]|nr:thioredoxin domain-containing protein [Myxococcaceae bacterium]
MVHSSLLSWCAAAALAASAAPALAAPADALAAETAALSPAARAEYDRALQDEFCGCGSPHSLGQCVQSHAECRHSRRLAQIAAVEASRGVTAAEIGVELARYDQGFRDTRQSFKVDERQCRGKGPVTLVEFSDFECPHCAVLRPILEKFAADNASKVRLCWMSFPLTQHPNSMPAAQATLFARDRGKLWAVHDALFENQRRLSPDVIQEILVKAGISAADWRKALADKTYKEQAETQRAAGVAAGVDATPTVFVNGRKLDLIPSAEILAITVEDELDWQKTRGSWTTATR